MPKQIETEAQTGLPPVPVIDDPDSIPAPTAVPAESVAALPPRRGRPPKAEGAAPTSRKKNGAGRKPVAVPEPAWVQANFQLEIVTSAGFYSVKDAAEAASTEELAKSIATALSEHIAAWRRRAR